MRLALPQSINACDILVNPTNQRLVSEVPMSLDMGLRYDSNAF